MVDRSAVGRLLTPVTARVEPGRLRYFLNTVGESNPQLRRPGSPVAPPDLFCLEMLDAKDPLGFLTELDIDVARLLHGEQGFTYHAPVHVGDKVTFSCRVTDVSEKKNGTLTLVMTETAVTNEHGVHVADLSRTLVIRNGPPA